MGTPSTTYAELFFGVVNWLIDEIEGGYSDRASDRGGETKYGISKRQYPELDIANLTKADAIAIYYRDYWLAYRCDELPPAFACVLFDAVVNHRPKPAVRFLQMALRITADGYIGPQTIATAKQAASSIESIRRFLSWCLAYRTDYFHDIAVDDPSQEVNVLGWFRRLFLLQQFIEEEVLV